MILISRKETYLGNGNNNHIWYVDIGFGVVDEDNHNKPYTKKNKTNKL